MTTAPGRGHRFDFLTSKERDVETGLDFFGARYRSAIQGRFTTPDPLLSSGRSYEPQSWNRYSYVLNRPLGLVDPYGLDWGVTEWYDDEGNFHRNYHYFHGEIGEYKGRNYTAVQFGSQVYRDINADDGTVVRISNVGIKRQVIYAPPSGTGVTKGQDELDLTAGLVSGIPIVGHAVDLIGGVNHESTTFQNGQIISTSVTLFAVIATGGGGLPGCLTNVSGGTTLFRAVTAAELASIKNSGGNYTVPTGLEGKYFFETAESASAFAQMMHRMRPQEGSYTITSVQVDKAVIQASAPVKAAGEGRHSTFPTPNFLWVLRKYGIGVPFLHVKLMRI